MKKQREVVISKENLQKACKGKIDYISFTGSKILIKFETYDKKDPDEVVGIVTGL